MKVSINNYNKDFLNFTGRGTYFTSYKSSKVYMKGIKPKGLHFINSKNISFNI